MRKSVSEIGGAVAQQHYDRSGFRVGVVVAITPENRPIVDFPGNPLRPMEARCITGISALLKADIPVLLAFDSGDPSLPIIIGKLEEPDRTAPLPEVILDGQRIILEAREEIVLRCGKSSIILRKDGKVIIKGADVVTRAMRTNKIKGAAVMIN